MGIAITELQAVNDAVKAYNDALKTNVATAIDGAKDVVKEAIKDYNHQQMMNLFSDHKDDENPVKSVLQNAYVAGLRAKVEKIDGKPVKMETEEAEIPIVIKTMMVYYRRVSLYRSKIERFCETMVKWAGSQIEADLSDRQYKLSKKAKAVDVGPNPLSNASQLKLLNEIIAEIIGDGSVVANNRDLKFIRLCCTNHGKQKLTVKTANASAVEKLILEVIYRILNNLVYDVECKRLVPSNPQLDAQKAANEAAKQEAEAETIVVEKEDAAAQSEPTDAPDTTETTPDEIVVPREDVA